MTPQEMREFMKKNYDDIDTFDNLPFVKSIRIQTAKEIFNVFDKMSCIKDDKWYIELKKRYLEDEN